jgi:hypothetical protein
LRILLSKLKALRRLAFALALPGRRRIFARRGVGMIHGEIVRPTREAERLDFVRAMIEVRLRDKLNDPGAHEKISQSKMRISPLTASPSRQAVVAMRILSLQEE